MNKVIIGLLLCAFVSCKFLYDTEKTTDGLSCAVNRLAREDCGYIGINQQRCEEKGCCWKIDLLVPWCFKGVTTGGATSKNTDANSKPGFSIEEMLKKKMGKIEEDINKGKTKFDGYEKDILSVFKNVNSKIQKSFNDFGQKIRDLWNRDFFYSYENSAAFKK
jgi:hypothetical protein